MKVADYIIERLGAWGVRHIFMLPGGGCMHLVDAVGRAQELSFVANLHEQACAIAAETYGQYTNRLGVALVTTGPGGTNAITGVAAAWLDSTPCLFLSGQVKRADRLAGRGVRQMGPQELDIVSVVRPITKMATTLLDPQAVRYTLEEAIYTARAGRPGPVWLDIPLDVQAAQIDPASLQGFTPPANLPSVELRDLVHQTIEALNRAQRPVLFVGNGVRLASATERLEQVVDHVGAPVLLTWKAADLLPDDHPLFAGRPGSIGQRGANFTQQNADFILILGARLDLPQVGFNPGWFARGATRVMVDVDRSEIDKMGWSGHISIVADVGHFLEELRRQQSDIAKHDHSAWVGRTQDWRRRYPPVTSAHWQRAGSVDNYALIDALSDELAADDLFVPGSSGACSEITFQALRTKRGQRILNSQGLGAMGFSLAAAIGGCLASGKRRTISIDGDGGFHMNSQELETLRRLGLPVKIFVLDNRGYGSIRATQRNYFSGRLVASSEESGLSLPPVNRIASAYGIATDEVSEHSELRKVVRRVLAKTGPVICTVHISVEQTTAPKLASRQQPDGTMASAPLEDLAPFLSREELGENMVIPLITSKE